MTTHNDSILGSNPPDELWSLLDRYLGGECTRSEAEEVRRLISAHPDVRVRLEALEEIRHVAGREGKALWNVEAMWARANPMSAERELCAHVEPASAIAQGQTREDQVLPLPALLSTPLPIPRQTHRVRWTSSSAFIALAAVLLVCVVALGRVYLSQSPFSNQASNSTVVATAIGQRASTWLPDGTHIVLAPGSTVRYSASYNSRDRLITLEGEAYFDVAHDVAKPFFVTTGSTRTEVLGTTFSVRKYATDPDARVIVSSGRVAVGGAVLTRGGIALVGDDGIARVERTEHPDLLLGWINDTLTFEHVPAHELLATLERWYGITFDVGPSVSLRERYSGTFSGRSADEAIRLVSALMNVDAKKVGPRIVLR